MPANGIHYCDNFDEATGLYLNSYVIFYLFECLSQVSWRNSTQQSNILTLDNYSESNLSENLLVVYNK